MTFNNKNILVTGGAGFIGSHLVDKLLTENPEKITIIDDLSGGNLNNIKHLENNPKVKFIQGSISNKELIQPLVKESDLVFSEAASKLVVSLNNPRIDVETNVLGVYNILEAALKSDTKIIHASTGSVYGSSDIEMNEEHPKNPSTIYGISKLAAEQYLIHFIKEHGLKGSVIRYFHVFGPRQDFSGEAGVVSIFISKVLKNQNPTIYSGGKQVRCFTYVDDDVDATLLLAKSNQTNGQAYNVASKTRMTINELSNFIIKKYGNPNIIPIMGKTRVGENPKPIPDTKKIEALGFKEKISFEEGLERTKLWVEKNN